MVFCDDAIDKKQEEMNTPLVTVYMPTKNRLELLQRAIDSVLGQTYKNIELIVVDDCSTDGTEEFLKKQSLWEPRLVYFRQEKSFGAPSARNRAILASKGEFVTGLDDDDEFTPSRIALFVEYWYMLKNAGSNPSFIYAQDILTIPRGKDSVLVSKKRGYANFEDMFSENSVGNQIFAPRQSYIDAGLFNATLPVWQDFEFYIRILKKLGPASLLDVPTYILDNTPRSDRITLKDMSKVRFACDYVIANHASSARQKQELLLMLFLHYGIRPKLGDWGRFIKLGLWGVGLLKMLRAVQKGS